MSAPADLLQAVLEAQGALPADKLAVNVRKRRTDVLKTLRSDSRFVHDGTTKDSLWDVRKTSVDAVEAAARWDCEPEMAAEILFGPEGFLELGIVASLNGNGRVVVTELGRELGLIVAAAGEALA